MSRVLVVTPQIEEFSAICAGFGALGHPYGPCRIGRLDGRTIPTLNVVLALGGHGKAQFAAQTMHLLDSMEPVDFSLCVGAAGGLNPCVDVGDLVVGTSTIEHDYRLRFVQSDLPSHLAHDLAIQSLRPLVSHEHFSFAVHFGAIASGDEDIVSSVRAAEIRDATGALCVAWEGGGGARAAALAGVPFVEIRGITDRANSTAHSDFHAAVGHVLPNASRLITAWLNGKR